MSLLCVDHSRRRSYLKYLDLHLHPGIQDVSRGTKISNTVQRRYQSPASPNILSMISSMSGTRETVQKLSRSTEGYDPNQLEV